MSDARIITRRPTRLDKKFDILREKTEQGTLKAASSNRALSKLAGNKLAVLGLAFVTIMILASVFAPLVTQYDPQKVDLRMMLKPPSADHILGTDKIGRDVFARIIYGGRISILVGWAVRWGRLSSESALAPTQVTKVAGGTARFCEFLKWSCPFRRLFWC